MIIVIDPTTVAVETSADLQSVLTGDNTYTTIYLAQDITLAAGFTIPATKTNIVIDGTYPLDGTGTMQTFTDMDSSNSGDTMNVQANGSLVITIQNMNIVGQNYYGIICVYDGVSGITINYVNVTYTGPQLFYNAGGYNSLIDCTTNSAASTASPLNELGEVSNLTIGGNTTINHQSDSGHAMLWFRGSSSTTLVFQANSNVVLNTTSYSFYTDVHPAITIGEGASVSFGPMLGMFENSGHYAGSLAVADGATLNIAPGVGATSAQSPSLVLGGDFSVGNGANVFVQSTLSSVSAVYFVAAATLTVTNPQSFVLYCNGATAIITNGYPITFSMSAEQINIWTNASSTDPGGIDDNPTFKWYRYNNPASGDYVPLSISGAVTSSVWAILTNNFTSQELIDLPALTNLLPSSSQVLSLGSLLTLNPIVDGQYPVNGTTTANAAITLNYTVDTTPYTDEGVAGVDGNFSVVPSEAIEVGENVEVTAHSPFLTGSITMEAIDAGEITLATPSEELTFVMSPLAGTGHIWYGRDDTWQDLVVSDTRVYTTPWQILASTDGDLTSQADSSHTLSGALIYVDETDEIYALGTDPVVVFANDGASGGDTAITWDDAGGILLQGDNVVIFDSEKYSANINWQIDLGE